MKNHSCSFWKGPKTVITAIRTLALVLVAAVAACADMLPTESHFYTCDSGFVDCNAFPKHWYGDYGMAGLFPPEWHGAAPDGHFIPMESNDKGQVVGFAFNGIPTLGDTVAAYGYGGQVHCIPGLGGTPFDCLEGTAPVDINNNGLIVWNQGYGPHLEGQVLSASAGGERLASSPAFAPFLAADNFATIQGLGLNDSDQILALIVKGDNTKIEGVLSPFAVTTPEPYGIALLASILGSIALTLVRRKSGKPTIGPH
jgi:hypothetical protein